MYNQPLITTNRLILRQWRESDFPLYAAMNADPDVMQYFPRLQTAEESASFIAIQQQKIADRGYGLFAVEVKDQAEFIGFIGLNLTTFEADFTPCIEIGWRLRKEFWNLGYATEGAIACLHYGFTEQNFHDIYSFTATLNLPSQRVMQKIGLTKVGEFNHPRVPEESILKPHVLYQITGEEFNQENTI